MSKTINEVYRQRDELLKQHGYSSYKEYLASDQWKRIKFRIRQRTGKKWNECNLCGSKNNLDVHHSSYKVIGMEHPGNTVKLLCRDCHQKIHDASSRYPDLSLYKIFGRIKSGKIKLGITD